jgi:endoglucanase
MDLDFQLFRNNFTGIPTFVGEWQASVTHTETAARWKYYDHFIRSCNKYNFSSVIWDNGEDFFNRTARRFYDPAGTDIVLRATRGEVNTLADSTTDQGATTQQTSAYIFHKAGTPIEAQTATYQMNGNTLVSVKNSAGVTLTSSQYTMSGGTLTLSAAYLTTLFGDNTTGTKDTLTLDFNRGASLTLQIVQYDTPTVAQNTYPYQEWDLRIPIQWAGVNKVAAVRALKADGVPLADDWTVWLGPLQQGRWTFGSWGWDKENFIVWASGLNAIRNSGQNVTLTVEFFPRSVGQNSLNITITP